MGDLIFLDRWSGGRLKEIVCSINLSSSRQGSEIILHNLPVDVVQDVIWGRVRGLSYKESGRYVRWKVRLVRRKGRHVVFHARRPSGVYSIGKFEAAIFRLKVHIAPKRYVGEIF